MPDKVQVSNKDPINNFIGVATSKPAQTCAGKFRPVNLHWFKHPGRGWIYVKKIEDCKRRKSI